MKTFLEVEKTRFWQETSEEFGKTYQPKYCEYNNKDEDNSPKTLGGCPRGVMVKAMDCGIVVCEFVLQSRYYVHFRANTLGKGMNPLILPAMG